MPDRSRTTDEIDADTHTRWLASVLADPTRTLLIADDENGDAATIRFDTHNDEAEISSPSPPPGAAPASAPAPSARRPS